MTEKDGIRGVVPSRAHGRNDRAFGAYLDQLDPRGREDVQIALAACPDARFKEFLERVMSPRFKRIGLASIAKACDIDLMEFTKWWSKASSQVAVAVAQNAAIEVTQDMAQDAKSVKAACPRCDGLGWVSAPSGLPEDTPGYRQILMGEDEKWIRNCPNCADGTVRKPGDTHARDKLLEMSGLVHKGGGAAVQIVQNFGGASHQSAVRDLDCITIAAD